MAPTPATFARRQQAVTNRIAPDRRRHRRVLISLLGRFMRANKLEYPCTLFDISVGGAAIMSPVRLEKNERIVAHFDELGALEGIVIRNFEGGFGVQFTATQRKREKIAAQLTWLLNRDELAPSDMRRHDRSVPDNDSAILKLAEDISVECSILDVSLSGASIATQARPPIGHEVMVGRLNARVVRYHDDGIGVRFIDAQEPTDLETHFG